MEFLKPVQQEKKRACLITYIFNSISEKKKQFSCSRVITWGELARLYLSTLFCIIFKPTRQSVVSSVEIASLLRKGSWKEAGSFCRAGLFLKSEPARLTESARFMYSFSLALSMSSRIRRLMKKKKNKKTKFKYAKVRWKAKWLKHMRVRCRSKHRFKYQI